MARHPKVSSDNIIDATARLAARLGPSQVTMASIAKEISAPTGSIYHRFRSRDILLAEVWLRAVEQFQQEYGRRLETGNAHAAGLAAALYVAAFVRTEPLSARILLLHRREDFLQGEWPDAVTQRARTVASSMDVALRQFAHRLTGGQSEATLRMLKFALVDAPMAAVLPHLRANQTLPPIIETLIMTTYEAIVGKALEVRLETTP